MHQHNGTASFENVASDRMKIRYDSLAISNALWKGLNSTVRTKVRPNFVVYNIQPSPRTKMIMLHSDRLAT
jgi:hypothetical protein